MWELQMQSDTKEIYIHHHLGLGDHVCFNGLIWYLIKQGDFDKAHIFCKNKYLSNLKHLYTDKKIQLIPIDENGDEIQIVDQIVEKEYDPNKQFIRIGFCPMPEGIPCDEHFYEISGVPYQERFDGFRIDRDEKEEQRVFEKLNPLGEDYIFIHDDINRDGKTIDVDTNYKIIKNDITESIFHYGKVIENAKEFHCIESCIRCYSEHLDTDGVKLFHHNSVRPNTLSSRKNWIDV